MAENVFSSGKSAIPHTASCLSKQKINGRVCPALPVRYCFDKFIITGNNERGTIETKGPTSALMMESNTAPISGHQAGRITCTRFRPCFSGVFEVEYGKCFPLKLSINEFHAEKISEKDREEGRHQNNRNGKRRQTVGQKSNEKKFWTPKRQRQIRLRNESGQNSRTFAGRNTRLHPKEAQGRDKKTVTQKLPASRPAFCFISPAAATLGLCAASVSLLGSFPARLSDRSTLPVFVMAENVM